MARTLGSRIGETSVRIGIAIVGLLVLRGIVSVIPMLRTQPIYTASIMSPQGQLNLQNLGQLQAVTAASLQALFQDAQRTALARGPAVNDPASQAQAVNEAMMSVGLAIFPITVVKALIDTFILVLLGMFGRSLSALFRSDYPRLPDLGLMISLTLLTIVAVIGYYTYQGLAYPFLMPDDLALYGWIFLALIFAPLVALAVVVTRNLDGLTALVMQSGSAFTTAAAIPAAVVCLTCGQGMPAGVKFCPHCGTAAPTAPARRFCQSCGAENAPTARFCKQCGQAV
jgi:hypothetical protein